MNDVQIRQDQLGPSQLPALHTCLCWILVEISWQFSNIPFPWNRTRRAGSAVLAQCHTIRSKEQNHDDGPGCPCCQRPSKPLGRPFGVSSDRLQTGQANCGVCELLKNNALFQNPESPLKLGQSRFIISKPRISPWTCSGKIAEEAQRALYLYLSARRITRQIGRLSAELGTSCGPKNKINKDLDSSWKQVRRTQMTQTM